MLRQTFCHIPGIGAKTEKKLWQQGITDWDKWQEPLSIGLSASTLLDAQHTLSESRQALKSNPAYFTSRLSSSETWRIFSAYRDKLVYLDIETTGMNEMAEVTTIALYDGKEVFYYINGTNLDQFIEDIYTFDVIVSYNGKSFDVPFLERFFRIRLDHAQIDLRHVLAKLGIKGGLKGCERQLGLNRGSLDGVNGYFAVVLWRYYQNSGDEKALETLLAYNIEDTVNLERLAVEAYNRNILQTPFADELLLECPPPPPNPCIADTNLVERFKAECSDQLL